MLYNHKQPCDCINCNSIRKKAFKGPGLYCVKSKRCFTWHLHDFVVHNNLTFDSVIYVFRELQGYDMGSHLDAVVGIIVDGRNDRWLDGPVTCVCKSSLEPLE
jgi:hypothetical protein